MDSKAFLENYKKLYDNYIAFIESGINKNVLKADEIVNDYLSELSNNNYSLKSYKAKIIRNEQEHIQNANEINDISLNMYNNLIELFNYYYTEYKSELANSNSYVNKEKDLKAILLDTKKDKQEVLIKRTAQEKDIQSKEKEFDSLINEIKSIYNGKLDSIKEKLSNDLFDNKANYTHSYSEDERKLLDVDDKPTINSLKKSINKKIIDGLEKEYEYKVNACESLESVEIEFEEKLEKAFIDYETNLCNKNVSIASFDQKLEVIDSILEEKEKIYDVDYLMKVNNKLYDYKIALSEILIKHSELMNIELDNTSENKSFIFDIALIYYYHLIINLIEENCYNQYILIIENIINEIKNNKVKYLTNIKELKEKEEKQKSDLFNALNECYNKNSKEAFIENVITSLGRFYKNLFNQIDSFNLGYVKTYTLLSFEIIKLLDDINTSKKIGKLSNELYLNVVNYKLFDLDFCNYKKSINEIEGINYSSLDEYIDSVKSKNNDIIKITKQYCDDENKRYETIKSEITVFGEYNKTNINQKYENIIKEIQNNLVKKINTIKKDSKKKVLEIKKSTKNRISSAEKSLKEAKKQII